MTATLETFATEGAAVPGQQIGNAWACRTLLVDDHPCVRKGVADLLEAAQLIGGDLPGDGTLRADVVAQAATGRQALALLREQPIDLAIVDLSLPDMDGAEVIAQIRQGHPSVRCIAFSFRADRLAVMSAMTAGASGYVLKTSDPEFLLRAISSALDGRTFLDPDVSGYFVPGPSRARHGGHESTHGVPLAKREITVREGEVLRGYALGLTAKEIARRLDLSIKTIETYKARGASKLKLTSRADIVRYGARQGWFEDAGDRIEL